METGSRIVKEVRLPQVALPDGGPMIDVQRYVSRLETKRDADDRRMTEALVY